MGFGSKIVKLITPDFIIFSMVKKKKQDWTSSTCSFLWWIKEFVMNCCEDRINWTI